MFIIVGVLLAFYPLFAVTMLGGGTIYDLGVGILGWGATIVYFVWMMLVLPAIWRGRGKELGNGLLLMAVGVILAAYTLWVTSYLGEQGRLMPWAWQRVPILTYAIGIVLLYAYPLLNIIWGLAEGGTSKPPGFTVKKTPR